MASRSRSSSICVVAGSGAEAQTEEFLAAIAEHPCGRGVHFDESLPVTGDEEDGVSCFVHGRAEALQFGRSGQYFAFERCVLTIEEIPQVLETEQVADA